MEIFIFKCRQGKRFLNYQILACILFLIIFPVFASDVIIVSPYQYPCEFTQYLNFSISYNKFSEINWNSETLQINNFILPIKINYDLNSQIFLASKIYKSPTCVLLESDEPPDIVKTEYGFVLKTNPDFNKLVNNAIINSSYKDLKFLHTPTPVVINLEILTNYKENFLKFIQFVNPISINDLGKFNILLTNFQPDNLLTKIDNPSMVNLYYLYICGFNNGLKIIDYLAGKKKSERFKIMENENEFILMDDKNFSIMDKEECYIKEWYNIDSFDNVAVKPSMKEYLFVNKILQTNEAVIKKCNLLSNGISFIKNYGDISVNKDIMLIDNLYYITYRIRNNSKFRRSVTLKIENNLSPSYIDIMKNGPRSFLLWNNKPTEILKLNIQGLLNKNTGVMAYFRFIKRPSGIKLERDYLSYKFNFYYNFSIYKNETHSITYAMGSRCIKKKYLLAGLKNLPQSAKVGKVLD